MAVIADIADAVVAELNSGSFNQTVAAQRQYLPTFDLAEMQNLQVTVVPKSVAILPGGRSHNQHDYAIDVAVQRKLQTTDNAEIDDLLTLVDEIADHFRFKRLGSFPDAQWLKTENEPVYAQEHLQELRQLTSILTLTFRVMR
ncbi:MAG: hypothetical protein HON53_18925 [Planctomycetaceae bacterium]|jgi:hypothetical protein|nr:hypothetical protein [Planctomycetaceae bacterium]MBT6498266.1 hypothetical protein [Planctomycetaceae bacterium]